MKSAPELQFGIGYYDSYDWEFLGSREVHRGLDRDVIYIDPRVGRLRALQLRTGTRRTDIHRAEVYYRNGEVQSFNLRRDRRGGESHIIDLPGRAREVRKVVFVGSNRGRNFRYNNRPVIELWGVTTGYSRGRRYDRIRDYRYYNNGFYRDDYYRRGKRRILPFRKISIR